MNDEKPRRHAAVPGARYPKLQFILFKRGRKAALAVCRGEFKGCNVQAKQRQKLGPCADCLACDNPDETLEQVAERLQRGDS